MARKLKEPKNVENQKSKTFRTKSVPISEKIKLFEEYLATGQKIVGKTFYKGHPLGLWAVQIRNIVHNSPQGQKIKATEEEFEKLKELGILDRQIESTIDEKIDSLIEWKTKYPKAKIVLVENEIDDILKGYSKTPEEYDELKEEYQRMLDYYKYVRERNAKGKLSKENFKKCKEGNVGGVFGYPKSIEKMAKIYGNSEYNIEYIISNYGTVENFYSLYNQGKIDSEKDKKIMQSFQKAIIDIDKNENDEYRRLIKDVFQDKDNPHPIVYSSKDLLEQILSLTSREQKIIFMKYALKENTEPIPTRNIAKQLNITTVRVGQYLAKANRKLRNPRHANIIITNKENIKNSKALTDDEKKQAIKSLEKIEKNITTEKTLEKNIDILKKTEEKRKEYIKQEKSTEIQEADIPKKFLRRFMAYGITDLSFFENMSSKELRENYKLTPNAVRELAEYLKGKGIYLEGEREKEEHQNAKKQLIDESNYKYSLKKENEEMSERALNALNEYGITYLEELTDFTYKELLTIKGLGIRSADEIARILQSKGLSLKNEENQNKKKDELANEDKEKEQIVDRIIEKQEKVKEQEEEIIKLSKEKRK